jgi:CrcB protein
VNLISTVITIGVGATIGATARYYLTELMVQIFGKGFPYGTLCANIIGSFLAGVFVVIVLEKAVLSETYRLMLLVGLTGSLTTMSALSLESVEMIGAGNYQQAALNILLNVLLSLSALGLGLIITRYLFSTQ